MQVFDNIHKTVKEDLQVEIVKNSRFSIAAACFSIYAFQELKTQLEAIDQLRFLFTSKTFADKTGTTTTVQDVTYAVILARTISNRAL